MKAIATSLQAVIFDWAGTTIDHGSRAPTSVVIEVFRRRGIEVTVDEARGPMGKAKRDHLASVFALPRVAAAWAALYGRPPVETDVDEIYSNFLPLQKSTLSQHCDVIPGIPETVAECRRRGLKIGASTGYTQELMDVVVPLARANGYSPDVSVCTDDVPHGRPAPWLLFRAAEALNVFPMTAVVAVDDTPVGIQAGINAGTWTVAVTRTGNSLGLSLPEVESLAPSELTRRLATAEIEFRRIGADYVIQSVADLIPILDDINAQLKLQLRDLRADAAESRLGGSGGF